MQLFVRGTSCTHVVDVSESDSVASVRCRLASLEKIDDSDRVTLSSAGVVLADDVSLSDLGGCDLEVSVGLLGGKVHGSLARAGKVKAQTPKVAKQEDKRKKKVGRAKCREKHRRRFVAVVATFGKKKGPNSNS